MASPASAAASSPHNTTQYLSALLSQRGPTALPYSEDVKLLIRQHLLNLMQGFPSLHAKPAPFVHNDGTSVHLLHIEGTIPMTFHGICYNIPVIIWLLESYPKSPPRVFVSPTKDMVIKHAHNHVDASGMVSIPYLLSWFYPRSNLFDLSRALSTMFSTDPPLFSKRSLPSPQPHRPNPVTAATNSPSSQVSAGSATFSSPRPSGSPMHQLPPSPQRSDSLGSSTSHPGRTENSRSGRTDSPSEVFRRNAINSLVERLKLDTSELRKTWETNMDNLVSVQSELKQRRERLKQGMEHLEQEKEALEQQLQILLTNTDVFRNWLKEQGESQPDIDIDNTFEPCDSLSKQMLECASVDLALEDVLYSLDKAVQEGSIPVDVYLKQVRNLSREQFFHRAMSAKIQACQQQTQVLSMAARHGL